MSLQPISFLAESLTYPLRFENYVRHHRNQFLSKYNDIKGINMWNIPKTNSSDPWNYLILRIIMWKGWGRALSGRIFFQFLRSSEFRRTEDISHLVELTPESQDCGRPESTTHTWQRGRGNQARLDSKIQTLNDGFKKKKIVSDCLETSFKDCFQWDCRQIVISRTSYL